MQNNPLTYAKIDIDNLKANFCAVRALVGESVKIMSVVKADAYGHGVIAVSKALLDAGTDCLGVANVDEAVEIREEVGENCDIFILSGGDLEKVPEIVKRRFIPAVYDLETLRLLNEEAKKAGRPVKVHLKFDTSMGRLGFFPGEAKDILSQTKIFNNLKIDGIMSHLSSADEEDTGCSFGQIKRFDDILSSARELGIEPAYKHIANSAAIINMAGSHYNMVRPGIMLYGSAPSNAMAGKADLKPVMSIKSRIISIKAFPEGRSISYSRTFTTKRESVIAVLPIGYADGFMRLLSNKGHVIINAAKAPVVGNVTMDLTMVDITGIDGVSVGDEATILGDGISAWDIAETTGTISYEIFTSVSKRVKRII